MRSRLTRRHYTTTSHIAHFARERLLKWCARFQCQAMANGMLVLGPFRALDMAANRAYNAGQDGHESPRQYYQSSGCERTNPLISWWLPWCWTMFGSGGRFLPNSIGCCGQADSWYSLWSIPLPSSTPPTGDFREAEPEDYEELIRRPGFMCVRARKGVVGGWE
jgi:hypothetical protein